MRRFGCVRVVVEMLAVLASPVVDDFVEVDVDFVSGQLERGRIVKQTAVEMRDVVNPETAAGLHLLEQLGQGRRQSGRIGPAAREKTLEQVAGQQSDVLREEAEDAFHQEMCGIVRLVSAVAERPSERRELPGDLFGDGLGSDSGLERVRIGEDAAKQVERLGLVQVGQILPAATKGARQTIWSVRWALVEDEHRAEIPLRL